MSSMGGVTGQPLCSDRQQRLRERVTRYELGIAEAERRIESHHKLWSLVAANSFQRHLQLELEWSTMNCAILQSPPTLAFAP